MSLQIVPKSVRAERVELWLGSFAPPGNTSSMRLEYKAAGEGWQQANLDSAWSKIGVTPTEVYYETVSISALSPSTAYSCRLRRDSATLASAEFETLPTKIRRGPSTSSASSRSFTVFLGSCFSVANDGYRVGAAYKRLYDTIAYRPHIKFLVGDQVYLDSPWQFFVTHRQIPEIDLRHRFHSHYKKTWTQEQNGRGFKNLLASGCNFFLSDDHEFWNNYPHLSPLFFALNTSAERTRWRNIAKPLFREVQSKKPTESFEIDPLSFFVADTRINRTVDRARFMAPSSFEKLEDWLKNLSGPGVLVLGQPVLQMPSPEIEGINRGQFFDYNLPDHAQYTRLVKSLRKADHDVVVLTGDVHFGRIATCTLNRENGTKLVEVISSPMSLVDQLAKARWRLGTDTKPTHFPPEPISGTLQELVSYKKAVQAKTGDEERSEDHFFTLRFYKLAGRVRRGDSKKVRMKVWAWLVDRPADTNTGLPFNDWSWRVDLK